MTQFHGIKITETPKGTRPLTAAALAVLGMVATSSGTGLDATFYPLNKPVLITNFPLAISKAGDEGTLKDALLAIQSQAEPITIVVRVAAGADATATNANIVGSATAGQRTGLQALLSAESQLGVRPRIIGVPELDTQVVTTALASVAGKLGAMAYASCNADTVADAVTYRNLFGARELMLITPDFKVIDGTSANPVPSTIPESPVARAMGLRAKIDAEQGWYRSLSNVAINGVTGLTQDLTWSLMDEGTDVALLNANEITAIIRRDGYRFWGCRTCSDDPIFAFETTVRTAQVLKDTIGNGLLWSLGKDLKPSLVKDIVETINNQFRLMVARGELIGALCWYDANANSSASLAAGELRLAYNYTPVPPLENLGLTQSITDEYFGNLPTQIA